MGLAPWASQWASADPPPPSRLTSGQLLAASANSKRDKQDENNSNDSFRLHWDAIEGLWRPNELGDPEVRPYYAGLASTAQRGLEEAAMAFVSGLRERTGEENLCLCGGVALNSVLNGKIVREVGGAGRRGWGGGFKRREQWYGNEVAKEKDWGGRRWCYQNEPL